MSTWKAFFAGDVFISNPHSSIVDAELAAFIAEHPLASCNFEAPIIPEGATPIVKAGPHVHQYPTAAHAIRQSGFTVASLANNHIYDYGQRGLEHTLAELQGLEIVGAAKTAVDAYQPRILTIQNTRVALISLAEAEFGALVSKDLARGGYAWVNHPSIDALVSTTRRECDVVIVQVHAGVEEIDLPLPEWRDRYRALIRAGADCVIGHHPHVPQGWELVDGKPIFYSLGNFFFEMPGTHPLWNRGLAVSLTFRGSALEKFEVIPVIHESGRVRVQRDPEFLKHLEDLCRRLDSPAYLNEIQSLCIDLWRTRYLNYYRNALSTPPEGRSLKVRLRNLKHALKGSSAPVDAALLFHNLRIESHRWATERALALLGSID